MKQTDPAQPLRDSRHEVFAQRLSSGMTQAQAYRDAGFSAGGANGNAARLIADDSNGIRRRVEWLKAQSAALTVFTRAEALGALREVAMQRDVPAARVSAVAQAAKMEGWNEPEKVEHGLSEELETRLRRLLGAE
jgi:hypothetical protein